MFSLWPLSATALAGLMYPVWQIVRTRRQAFRNGIASDSQPGAPLPSAPEPARAGARVLKWISIDEFMAVLAKCKDLILVDLREDAQWVPFPVQAAVFVLPVALHELTEVLERLPADRVVVFYGVSDLSILMIEISSRMKGLAQLYVLDIQEGGLDRLKAA